MSESMIQSLKETLCAGAGGGDACAAAGLLLTEAHCCPYCVLRLLGVKKLACYQVAPETLRHALSVCAGLAADAAPLPAGQHCPGCADTIARCHDDAFRRELVDAVAHCGFQYDCYILNVHQLVAFNIRQHALWLFGREHHPAVFPDEQAVADVKEAMKWILGPYLAHAAGLHFKLDAPFRFAVDFEDETLDAEATEFLSHFSMQETGGRGGKRGRGPRREVAPTAMNAARLLQGIDAALFRKHFACPAAPATSAPRHRLGFSYDSVFVAGRYNKYSSELSQTPWFLDDGTRLHEGSVEELVCGPLQRFFGADEYRFSASGREDIDVRMLGNGRPFYVELVNAHAALQPPARYAEMQAAINASTALVQVAHLQPITAAQTARLKEAEASKIKHYRALVWTSKRFTAADRATLEAVHDLPVAQLTPLRVLHRRTLATRHKVVHSLAVEQLSPHFVVLSLKTSAGTYIKEFVHGDLGRTQPNIGSLLGCDADILQLDVTAVETDFPPPIRPAPELPHSFCLPESFIIADRNTQDDDEDEGDSKEDHPCATDSTTSDAAAAAAAATVESSA